MTKKYQNKYRTESNRLQNWDYGWNGYYFITICTQNRKHYFGDIINDKMNLSNMGAVANVLWYEIKNHSNNLNILSLGDFVVMPNHIHGVLILNGDNENETITDTDTDANTVETRHALSLQRQNQPSIGQKRFQNQGKNTISSIIGSYKSAVTKHLHRLNFEFQWQKGFYDHIIRNEKSYNNIIQYIKNNPSIWEQDRLNKEGVEDGTI